MESFKIPNEIILKNQLKECMEELSKAHAKIDDLLYKNAELVKLCKEKYETYTLNKEEIKKITIETRKEELYNNLKRINLDIMKRNRILKKENKELIQKLNGI